MTLPVTGTGKPRPFNGGGWIDGPCNPPPRDEYNPALLVQRVAQLLTAEGLNIHVDQPVALNAAGNLLRALSVEPSSAPWATARRTAQGG